MQLTATCTLSITNTADCPLVAMLRARHGEAQQILHERFEVHPWVPFADTTDVYGNLCQRMVLPPGPAHIAMEVTAVVDPHIAVAPDAAPTPVQDLPDSVLLYLLQSRYCPSDKLGAQALAIVGAAPPGYAQAEAIRAWIHANLQYQYGVSSASPDALDTLGHGAGVCRDFAHVGIALCRSLRLPARIVVGYLHGLEPMDLHAWFEVFVGGRWYTFDATQTQPRGGRIVLAYGRDAADVAFISDYGSAPLEIQSMQVTVDLSPHALIQAG
ncbi:MAG: transglutaminase family protein [Ferruginibacter sp.]|nr:transglutaminase family protein [Rhodoferax sp.]